ncbi:hypothetical protein D3C84_791340 [compost metagenome]
MHQPHLPSLDTIETRRRQGQAPGLGQADALHHERHNLCGQQTEAGFRQAELRRMIGHGDIADTGQAETTAQHGALQDRDHHLWRVLHLLQQRTEHPVQIAMGIRTLSAGIGHVLDIAAGTEVPTDAADHQGANPRFIADRGQHRTQFGDHLHTHGVATFRAVEGDVQHAVVQFQQQGLANRQVVHFFLPGRMPMSLQMIPSMISSAPPPIDTRRTSR